MATASLCNMQRLSICLLLALLCLVTIVQPTLAADAVVDKSIDTINTIKDQKLQQDQSLLIDDVPGSVAEHATSWYKTAEELSKLDFVSAFIASTSMILVCEVGDKTFFIAAIMAMKHARQEVFTAAMSALIVMTILSTILGAALPALLDRRLTQMLATFLFFYFGLRLLYDAYHMQSSVANLEELEEVENELLEAENSPNSDSESSTPTNGNREMMKDSARDRDMESGKLSNGHSHMNGHSRKDHDANGKPNKASSMIRHFLRRCFSRVWLQVFTMTFLAEWGDRSQIATIALAAANDPIGTTVGASLGHVCCTGVAVLGGKLLATRISERTIAMTGGALFLVFAFHSLLTTESATA